ncbi:MAG: hypothetical protein IPF79_05635 [Ignavibacteria bacterium]|nr:hypothetical protein [Ignavibacteria bacterium]
MGRTLGLGLRFRPDTVIEVEALAGYGFEDKQGYGSAKTTWFIGERQKWTLDAALYKVLQDATIQKL